jgi:[ribosomal protein S5]-alanine N-acetyltransferase
MEITLDADYSLSPVGPGDKAAYLIHLADPAIYQWTLRIPFPYRPEDADWWIAYSAEEASRLGQIVNFALREKGQLIGGCGFNDFVAGTHKAEIGYWLAKPWWGKGIMPRAVEAVVRYGFEKLGLIRVTATIFEDNEQSARVLEKCGFEYEGRMRNYYLKDGRALNARMFARFP